MILLTLYYYLTPSSLYKHLSKQHFYIYTIHVYNLN
jgi:hypothetical protein